MGSTWPILKKGTRFHCSLFEKWALLNLTFTIIVIIIIITYFSFNKYFPYIHTHFTGKNVFGCLVAFKLSPLCSYIFLHLVKGFLLISDAPHEHLFSLKCISWFGSDQIVKLCCTMFAFFSTSFFVIFEGDGKKVLFCVNL